MPITTYLGNKLLDHAFRNTAYTPPATVYAGLMTTQPTIAGGGTEVAGNNYARVAISWSAAAALLLTNSAQINFPTPSGSWGTVKWVTVWDALSGGNMMGFSSEMAPQSPGSGATVNIATGDLDLTMA